MPRYLLTMSEENAAKLERWLGGRVAIGPPLGTPERWSLLDDLRAEDGHVPDDKRAEADRRLAAHEPVPVAGLDAITDEEAAQITERLRVGPPLYHFGGPTGAGSTIKPAERPVMPPGTRLLTLPENERVIISFRHTPPAADISAILAWFTQAGLPVPLLLIGAQVGGQPAVLYGENGMEVALRVAIEPKDEYYPGSLSSGVSEPGVLPQPEQVGAHVSDILGDETKHNAELGWRVTRVVHA